MGITIMQGLVHTIAWMGALTLITLSTAQAQTLHGTHGDWNVYTVKQDGSTVCYIASAPVKKTGNYKKRGEPYALITHRSTDLDEFSISSGYPYKKESEVQVHIDGVLHKLFTKDELAWAYDEHQDQAMVKAMKRGMKMKARGNSQVGSYSEDSYSLKGFTNAYNAMKDLCK